MDFAVQPVSFNDVNSTNDPTGRNVSALNHHKAATTTASPQAVHAVQPTHDTVKLSVNSQIQALKQKGASIVEIATKLGLSITDVDQALHLTLPGAVTQSVASVSGSASLSAHR